MGLGVLKKALRLQSQSLKRSKMKQMHLKEELVNWQRKMQKIENSETDEILKKYDISKPQVCHDD